MANPRQRYDPIRKRMIEDPQGPPQGQPQGQPQAPIYHLLPNRYNGLDVQITFGGYAVAFNTNEQRFVHQSTTVSQQPKDSVINEFYGMRTAAGREPFYIPEITIKLLDDIVNHHIQQHTVADEAHWVKVNLPYGEGDRAKVIDERVDPLPKSLSDSFKAMREAAALEALASQTPSPQPSTSQASASGPSTPEASASRVSVPVTTARPAARSIVEQWNHSPPTPYIEQNPNSPLERWSHSGLSPRPDGGEGES